MTARGLANVYAQTLGTIFSSAAEKPYEVELVVAEVGETPEGDQIYRLPHDGSIVDEHGSVAVGGNAELISSYLDQRHQDGMSLAEALQLAVQALSRESNGSQREIPAERLEVAVLDRTRPQSRKFKRIVGRLCGRGFGVPGSSRGPVRRLRGVLWSRGRRAGRGCLPLPVCGLPGRRGGLACRVRRRVRRRGGRW